MASLIAVRALEMILKRCDGASANAKTEALHDVTRASYWHGKVAAYEDIEGLARLSLDSIGQEKP